MASELETVKALSAPEKELLKALSNPESTIEVIIPEDIQPKEWLSETKMVCGALSLTKRREQAFTLALGRLLYVARKNSEIVRAAGYENWNDFLLGKICGEFGVERTTCYDAEQIATRWKSLQVAEVVQIGRRKMKLLTQVIEAGKEDGKTARAVIEKAKSMSESQLRNYCIDKGLIEKGETQGAFVHIGTSKVIAEMWEKFSGDERIQAAVGSGNAGQILLAMMRECRVEWLAKGEASLDGSSKVVEVPVEASA